MQLKYSLLDHGFRYHAIAGTDEAGRGPLAGDVVAAAVILDPQKPIEGIDDSKKLSDKKRKQCFLQIVSKAKSYSIASASVEEIDALNILQASLLAMHRAVMSLSLVPDLVYVDGNRCPEWTYESAAVVKGDSRLQCIAAASILAKVARDEKMQELDSKFPGYGFGQHKGYPTKSHLIALKSLGPCQSHRRSFKPVADLL